MIGKSYDIAPEPEGRPGLIALMMEDARAALERDPAAEDMWFIVLFSSGTHIVWAHRRHHWLWEHGLRTLALFLSKRMRNRLGADIHPAATIGRRFTVDHGIGIVIGGTAVIGDDCQMYQGVTLGMTGKKLEGKRHPTLGDGVFLGANAVVLGDIHLGDGARVGAGAVVVDDVPAGATVIGVPARVVRRRAVEPSLAQAAGGGEAKDSAASVPALPDIPPAHLKFRLVNGGETPYDSDIRWSCGL